MDLEYHYQVNQERLKTLEEVLAGTTDKQQRLLVLQQIYMLEGKQELIRDVTCTREINSSL